MAVQRGGFDSDFCVTTTFDDGIVVGWYDETLTDQTVVKAQCTISYLTLDEDLSPLASAIDYSNWLWFDVQVVQNSLVSNFGFVSESGNASVAATGLSLAASTGTVAETADASVASTANSLTSSAGSTTETGTASIASTGTSIAASVGTVTESADANVALSANLLSSATG